MTTYIKVISRSRDNKRAQILIKRLRENLADQILDTSGPVTRHVILGDDGFFHSKAGEKFSFGLDKEFI